VEKKNISLSLLLMMPKEIIYISGLLSPSFWPILCFFAFLMMIAISVLFSLAIYDLCGQDHTSRI